jgi:ribonuclease BN (tRNA processing enzyme)
MQIKILGNGSYFTGQDQNSTCFLLSHDNMNMLVDVPYDIREILSRNDLTVEDIHYVYISHLHTDHVGGLEFLAFYTAFLCDNHKLTLIVNENIIEDLRGMFPGLKSDNNDINKDFDEFFNVNILKDDSVFRLKGFPGIFSIHNVPHIAGLSSSSLFIKTFEDSVWLTTDKNMNDVMLDNDSLYIRANKILHDCSFRPNEAHASYDELKNLPEEIRKKIILVHYNESDFTDEEVEDFGFVLGKQGKILEIVCPESH